MNLIRDNLELQTAVSPIHDDPYTDAVFDELKTDSKERARNVILKCAPKARSLYPIPTSLFVECLDELLTAVTHIINSSLASGFFFTRV